MIGFIPESQPLHCVGGQKAKFVGRLANL